MATRNVRTYDHFCPIARTLESVGDRWSLLVVRDLLTGEKRFTDLLDRLGGITPKTLSQRLRELEAAGLVVADREPGRREVRYRLTSAGVDLRPVVEALNWWGLRHSWRRPLPGEPLHAEHLLRTAVQAIDRVTDRATDAHAPTRWHLRLDGEDYLVESDGHSWSLSVAAPSTPADVTVIATTPALAAFIFGTAADQVDISGKPAPVRRFTRLIRTAAKVVDAA